MQSYEYLPVYIILYIDGDCDVCHDCYGKITLDNYGTLCSNCSEGHKFLKSKGVETKWNKKVD